MMTTTYRVFCLAFVIGAVVVELRAQTKPATTRSAPVSRVVQKPSYTFDRFDLDAERLPAQYLGNSLEQTYLRLITPPKREFETTAEYQARISKPEPDELFAFVMEPNSDSGPIVTYDADTGAFKLELLENNGGGNTSATNPWRALVLKSTVLSKSESMRSNAFGASVNVVSQDTASFGILIDRTSKGIGNSTSHKLFVSMPPDRARAFDKGRLRVVFVCKPYTGDQPQTYSNSQYLEASISSPYEARRERKYLRIGEIVAVWLYDFSDGTVFEKRESLDALPTR